MKVFEIWKELREDLRKVIDIILSNNALNLLWRKIAVVVMLVLLCPNASAQLKIEKLKLPQGIVDYGGGEAYPYQHVMYNFSEGKMRPVVMKEMGAKVDFTVWELDFSKIYRQFSITLPQDYSDGEVESLGYFGGRFADSECRLILTQDLFNDDGLIEVVLFCNSKDVSLIMNEHSELLAISDEGVYFNNLLDPALTGGMVVSENGCIVRKAHSSVSEKMKDQIEGLVTPNPSKGANSITISWDYVMLNEGRLNVIDLNGKLVHSQMVKSGTSKLNLAATHLATGHYIYIIEGDNGYRITGKFVIN